MKFAEITATAMTTSAAEQTEVVVLERDDNLTRFANNAIHQNVREHNTQIIVRAVVGRRVGIASSNDARRESIERLTGLATALAKLQPENPEFHGLPEPKALTDIQAYDEATGTCTPQVRADRVAVICRKATAAGMVAAGSMSTARTRLTVANSLGVRAQFESSAADMTMVVMAEDSSGWAQQSAWRIGEIDAEARADEAIRKARIGAHPREQEPGEYPVILDPYATADLVGMLAFDGMSAMSVQEGRSWLNGRMGQQVMAPQVTITDNALDPAGIPVPFDFEGMPKKVVRIVDAGVALGPVYDSFTAGRESGKESTGHALPPSPSERHGPLPFNLFLRPGTSSLDEMIRSTKLGLYITRFWYTRSVQPRDAVITGMTRDGTFVIRDGEIAYPVKSLRFTQSYVEALKNTEAIGSTSQLMKAEWISASMPAIKLSQFRFTSGTR